MLLDPKFGGGGGTIRANAIFYRHTTVVVFAERSVDDAVISGHIAVYEGKVFFFDRPGLKEFAQFACGLGIFPDDDNTARFAVQPIDEMRIWLAGRRHSQVNSDAANQTGALIRLGGMTYQARRLVEDEQFVILKKNLKKVLHKCSRLFDDAGSLVRNSLLRDDALTEFFSGEFDQKTRSVRSLAVAWPGCCADPAGCARGLLAGPAREVCLGRCSAGGQKSAGNRKT